MIVDEGEIGTRPHPANTSKQLAGLGLPAFGRRLRANPPRYRRGPGCGRCLLKSWCPGVSSRVIVLPAYVELETVGGEIEMPRCFSSSIQSEVTCVGSALASSTAPGPAE